MVTLQENLNSSKADQWYLSNVFRQFRQVVEVLTLLSASSIVTKHLDSQPTTFVKSVHQLNVCFLSVERISKNFNYVTIVFTLTAAE